MTLKEKFEEFTDQKSWQKANYDAMECERIADEFAIGFIEWSIKSENRLGYHEKNKEWYNWHLDKWTTTKELLEIYKREQEL
jgi:hypothetical protein